MKKIILYPIIIASVLLFIISVNSYLSYKQKFHNVIFNIPNKIISLLNKESQKRIKKSFAYSLINESDVLANFIYDNNYELRIWDWNLTQINLLNENNIRLCSSIFFLKESEGQVLNSDKNRRIVVDDLPFLNGNYKLLIENNSKIYYFVNQSNLVGVIGDITQVSITDKYNVERIRISEPKYDPNMFIGVLLKNGKSYLVMIESKKKITPDILQIFE